MSLANYRDRSDPDSSGSDQDDDETVFRREIEGSTLICNRCYRRTHLETVYSELYRELFPVSRVDRWRSVESEGVYPPRERSPYSDAPASHRASNGRATACRCGALDRDHSRDGPLPTERALELASRVSDRLQELDVDHDREQLLEDVERRKRDSEQTGRDEEILDQAVEQSIA